MSASTDWRSPPSRDVPDGSGRPEFAAEFLRRNRAYHTDHARMVRRIAAGAVSEDAAQAAFARRWGLSFRLYPERLGYRAVLATNAGPDHDCPRRCT